MRYSMIDLMIAIVIIAGGVSAGVQLAQITGRVGWSMALGVLLALVFYLVFTPLLYRRFRLLPLLMPRCPHCKDANRDYYIGRYHWPHAEILCSICGHFAELWFETPEASQISAEMPSLLLVWPQSWGRWRFIEPKQQSENSVNVQHKATEE